jgi:hypothetical protein
MWKKYGTARQAIDDNMIRRMRFACWMAKATDIQSEYAILIAFSWQQWLRERASMLRDTYTVIKNHIRYHVLLLTWICLTRGWTALHRSHRTL